MRIVIQTFFRTALMAGLLGVSFVSLADIYKCIENGNAVFSDQPCSDQAEKLELKVRQPQQQDIDNQQQLTATFQEESRVNQIHALNNKNAQLQQQIESLQQAQQTELNALAEKTYRTEDGRIATSEHGLFDQMNQVMRSYQQDITQLQQQIQNNQSQLSELHQQNPKNQQQKED